MHLSNFIKRFSLAFLGLSMLAVSGCTPGQEPFRQVQFCFTKENGARELRNELKQVSVDEKMIYRDVSEQSYDQIKGSAPQQALRNMERSKYVSIFVGKNDGMGLGAGNLGLGGDQVALAFTAGSDPRVAKQFSERVLYRIQKRWKIKDVEKSSGALPLQCSLAQ